MRRPSVRVIVCAFGVAGLVGPASALAVPVAAPSNTPLGTWQAQGRVSALAISNGVVYLGGSFTSLTSHGSSRKTVTRKHLAAINPVVNVSIGGRGKNGGWFGWSEDAKIEGLREAFARASSPDEQKKLIADFAPKKTAD